MKAPSLTRRTEIVQAAIASGAQPHTVVGLWTASTTEQVEFAIALDPVLSEAKQDLETAWAVDLPTAHQKAKWARYQQVFQELHDLPGQPVPESAPPAVEQPQPKQSVPATDRQARFLRDLLDERQTPEAWSLTPDQVRQRLDEGQVTKTQASAAITSLLDSPRKASASTGSRPSADDIPASRYAVKSRDGDWEFYQVDKPTKGRWEGYTFLSQLFGSPGDFNKRKIPVREAASVYDAIRSATYQDGSKTLTGPEAAAVAFSREHGVCAACLAPLTDPESIARGLGPICAGRF